MASGRAGRLGPSDASARTLWFVLLPPVNAAGLARFLHRLTSDLPAGASSAIPREEPAAFTHQLEGTWCPFWQPGCDVRHLDRRDSRCGGNREDGSVLVEISC